MRAAARRERSHRLTDASNACLRTPTHNPSFLDLSRSLLHRYCNRIEEAVSAILPVPLCVAPSALQCPSAVNAPANRTFKVISRRSGVAYLWQSKCVALERTASETPSHGQDELA